MVADPDRHSVLSFDTHSDCVLYNGNTCRYQSSIAVSKMLSQRIPPTGAVYFQGRFFVAFTNVVMVFDAQTMEVVHMMGLPAQCLLLVGNKVWVGGEGIITIISAEDYSVCEQCGVGLQSIIMMIIVKDQVWVACKDQKKNGGRVELHQFVQENYSHVSMFRTEMKDVFTMTTYGDTVWAGSDNPSICVYDVESKECVARITSHPVAFSLCALSDQVWFGSRDEIVIVNPKTYACVGELRGYHTGSVFSILPLNVQDHVEVWTGSFDKSVCVWSVTPLPDLCSGCWIIPSMP